MNSPESGGGEQEKSADESGTERRLTDQETADAYIGHLTNPCGTTLPSGQEITLASFWIREAERALSTFTDNDAKAQLQSVIKMARIIYDI